ncbi:murein biosynthesis integral membrane protein MurJ [Acetoanaerobium noterae]|uniref:murein biosynthesis integral membrane protein MurJ n=1 Tax=Acetoanaerobium noterae TaxID=745369 RepID=UPI003341B3E3
MKKTALLLMAITILSKIIGFGREIVLSYYYGASNISDAYLISTTIPGVIFSFVSSGLIAGYIPMYSSIFKSENKESANNFTSNLINLLLIVSLIIIGFSFIFSEAIVKLFASGFDLETFNLTVKFTRVSLFAILFSGIVSIFSGYLQLKNNYIIPAIVGFPMNFILIISIIFSKEFGNYFLAYGYILAVALQVFVMLPYMKKSDYIHKRIIKFKDEHIVKMIRMAVPIIIGVSVNQINVLVDRTIASKIVVGGVSALNYADKLNGFVQGIFVLSISTALYPMISKLASDNDMCGFKKLLKEAMLGVSILVIPAMMGITIFSSEIVSVLFGRGEFDKEAIEITSSALFFYSFGMIGYGLRELLSRAFYAIQDTKTPMINATIGVVTNIILNLILSKFLGIGGLALATSISALLTTSLLIFSLKSKIDGYQIEGELVTLFKIVIASLIMGFIAKILNTLLYGYLGMTLALLISIISAIIVYAVVIFFMRIAEVNDIIAKAKHIFDK